MKFKNIILEEDENQAVNDFLTLMKIKLKKISPYDVSFPDKRIADVNRDTVTFSFDSFTDFLKEFVENDEGTLDSWVWAWNQPYSYDWYDCYNTKEDWDNGYIFPYAFTPEQIEKTKEIISYLNPGLVSDFEDNRKNTALSNTWDNIIEELNKIDGFADKIQDAYCEAEDHAISARMEEYTNKKFKALKDAMSLNSKWDSWRGSETLSIPIDDIIAMYSRRGETNLSIFDIVKKNLERTGEFEFLDSEPMETAWNIGRDEEEFRGIFDRYVDSLLDDVLESIKTGEYNLDDIKKSYSYIQKKGGMNTAIKIPNSDVHLKFDKINPDGTIDYTVVENKTYRRKKANGDVETIDRLFNNYSLFDIFD